MNKSDYLDVLLQGMMFRCLNWGDPDCHSEVREFTNRGKIERPDQDTKDCPFSEELKRLNDFCMQCNKAVLEIYENKCPICGSTQIEPDSFNNPTFRGDKSPNVLYPYKCAACGRILFSGRKY